MSTFEFEGKLYKAAPEPDTGYACGSCAFGGKRRCNEVEWKAANAGVPDCVDGFIYVISGNRTTPADIARRIGEEAATYAEQAIANKIADALEDM